MANINSVIIGGRLTRDPELRFINNGQQAVTNFNVAVNRNLSKDKREELEAQGKQTADFINVQAWSNTAEFIANNFKKGDRIIVEGNIRTGQYQNADGNTIYTTDVNAYNVHKLDWNNSNNKTDTFDDIDGFEETDGTEIPF